MKEQKKQAEKETPGQETHESQGIVDTIWDFFSSMKTGLLLLGLLVIAAGIGTIIPQQSSDPTGAQAANQIWKTLGFTNLYGAIWFRVLLGVLCLNLIICSIQRFGGIYNRAFRPTPPRTAGQIPNKLKAEISGDFSPEQVTGALHKSGFRVHSADKGEAWGFVAVKRRWGYWGSLITHLAFVIIAIGAFVGSVYGVKGYLTAGAGETVAINKIDMTKGIIRDDFSVKINSAEDRKLENGSRDNWYTDLSILQGDKEVAKGTLSVNHPFEYNGYTFYQSSFYTGASFNVSVDGHEHVVVLRNEGDYQIEGTNYYLYLAAMKTDSDKPAVLYQIYDGLQATQPMQQNTLVSGDKAEINDKIQIQFNGLAGYTGLQVKKDPGVWIVWIGFAFGMLGLLLSFYWRPVALYGIIRKSGKENTEPSLVVGTETGKIAGKNAHEFEAFVKAIKE